MNIATFSPALTLLYVFALLWILMGVDYKSFGKTQRRLLPLAGLLLCAGNHLLREMIVKVLALLGFIPMGNDRGTLEIRGNEQLFHDNYLRIYWLRQMKYCSRNMKSGCTE